MNGACAIASKPPPDTPPDEILNRARQVSWLAGLRFPLAFPMRTHQWR